MQEPSKSLSQGRWFATIGACLQVIPANLTIGTAINLARDIQRLLSQSRSGAPDPSRLSALIGEALISITAGMLLGLVGAALIFLSIYLKRYRAPWLFWLMAILGVVYLPALPLGTLIGLGFLVVALTKRKELLATK